MLDINKDIIGIIGAMDDEVALFKEKMVIVNVTTIAQMDFYQGSIENRRVVVVKCGMGKVNAGLCAHILINNFSCTKIINTGVAGALDSRLEIGDIVVSTDAVQHDFTVEAIGFKKGEIPYTGLYAFKADDYLKEEALKAIKNAKFDVNAYEGRICTGDQFISTKEQKETIVNNFNGMCCEMEGAAVAQVCYLNNVPFVIIRAVSDNANGEVAIDFNAFASLSAKRSSKIVLYMLEHI